MRKRRPSLLRCQTTPGGLSYGIYRPPILKLVYPNGALPGTAVSTAGFSLHGGCICMGGRPCCSYGMQITPSGQAQGVPPQGSLTKVAGGCAECLTGANRYAIVFPPQANAEARMALLASAVHVDLNYFEKKKNNN